jgi:hypothetical protein
MPDRGEKVFSVGDVTAADAPDAPMEFVAGSGA